jgi:5-methylcytosine-specific restriction protein B
MQAFYVLGSTWQENEKGYDQTDRFLKEGIWENGYDDRFLDIVKSVNVGDRVAIKSSYAKGHDSILRIKALGTVVGNPLNGKQLIVKWDIDFKPFDLSGLGGYRNTIQKVSVDDIQEIFGKSNPAQYSSELRKFLDQAKTSALGTANYIKEYSGLKTKVSFGQGNSARIPWIAFLRDGQSVQNGIYPVYLFYKEKELLVLSYGVSETVKPAYEWEIKHPETIQDFFNKNSLGKADRYGSSYVFKAYHLTELPSNKTLDADLNQVLEEYKKIHFGILNTANKNSIDFNINSFIQASENIGLVYFLDLNIRFVASLLTKPFLLLSGLSGSGKTKIAQAFAKWICEDQNQYCLVAVGADWTNREPLLGYPNALEPGTYVKPDNGVLDLLMHANAHQNLPHFLILDEMNLSHVERYFADFLSVMESNEELNLHPEELSKNGVPGKISLPKNLFIIGTVNIDETTYMFSPKVLDRANTIEFRVTLEDMKDFLSANKPIKLDDLIGEGKDMAEDFVALSSEERDTMEEENIVHDQLISFFKELRTTGSEFGYRTANEMLTLIYRLWQIDTQLTRDEKIDIAVIQKLLPKLHGSRNKLKKPLEALAGLCLHKPESFKPQMLTESVPAKSEIRYPLSFEKLGRMYRNLLENGYTSFAEA